MARLDRRALFTSGAAAALLAASGVSLQAAPRSGGRLRLALPRDESLSVLPRGAVCESLTQTGPDGVLRGELALDWQTDAQARDWLFRLKPGVAFHDGTALGAEDVAAALGAAGYAALAAGSDLVSVHLDQGDPALPLRLASVPVLPRGVAAEDGAGLIGSGTYRVARLEPGRSFLLQRVSGHHRQGQAGWADSVEAVVIPDADVRAQALRDGYVDVAVLPAPDSLRARAGLRFHPDAQNMVLAAAQTVGLPRQIARAPLDGGRLAERWWRV